MNAARKVLQSPGAMLVAVFVLTVLLRVPYLNRSFDIFVDEANYLSISQSIAADGRVATHEGPFYLHPPAFFLLEAGFLRLVRPAGNIVAQIYAARYLSVLLAGCSAVMLLLLGRRVAGTAAGLGAALIFGLEPWIIRVNSRNFLETPALLAILAGYCLLAYNIRRPNAWVNILGVGGLFGLALLTKEMTLFVTLLPLGACFLLNWSIPRRTAVLIGAVTCLVYAIYPLVSYGQGEWSEFVWQKRAGIFRFTGSRVVTGFNQEQTGASPSFADAILYNLEQFATTYALIGCGVLAVGMLILAGGQLNRLIAIWTASAYLFQGYNVTAGTNEEHLFYYLVVPASLAISVATVVLFRSSYRQRLIGRRLVVAGSVVATAFAAWCGYIWLDQHLTPDNGNERLVTYLEQNVPGGSRIATTTITSDWLLHDYQFATGRWGTVDSVCSNKAEYVIISSKLVATRHDIATPDLEAWLVRTGTPVFSFQGPSNGQLSLYQVPPQACVAAQAAAR